MPRASSVSGGTAPGGWGPSFHDALAQILEELREHGWAWRLTMLWVVMGAGGAVYAFVCTTVGCTTRQCTGEEFWFVLWNGEPGAFYLLGNLAEMVWPLLTVLLLVAGFVRLRGWRLRNWRRTAAWAGAWVAGIALMALLAVVAGVGSEAPNLAWGTLELPIFAAWLALGTKMTSLLAETPGP
ncbi:MAG: hypothetical protein LBV34_23735 [Nocardiopsaceae bacterium]|jgi:hypothetical protein|nr:hypothetical protein [Nocardiopsaceae bacterium]